MDAGEEQKTLSTAAAVVRNPLSVIAMFVLMVELIATVTLVKTAGTLPISVPLVWFVVLFPTLIAMLFFFTLWNKHQFLYSPMEYRSDESFLTAMKRLDHVEARQEAAELNPQTTSEAESLVVVDRLLKGDDLRAAVKVGRTFLMAGQPEAASRIFQHIIDRVRGSHPDIDNAFTNLAYSQIAAKKYKDAIANLMHSLNLIGDERAQSWHHLALAYAYFKLAKDEDDPAYDFFRQHLAAGKSRRGFMTGREKYKSLYPEISKHL